MRISDWSSDVCSSDLERDPLARAVVIDLRIADAVGQIGPAGPAERVGGTGDAAVGVDDPVTLGIDRAGRAIGADLVHDHAFGARDEVAARIVGHQAEAADVGVEGLADQHRKLAVPFVRSEEHTSELQSLMRNSYAVFCLTKTTSTQT